MKIIRILFLILLISCMLFSSVCTAFADQSSNETGDSNFISDERIKEVESFINSKMKKSDAPGLSLIIVNNDKVAYYKGFGYADREKKLPVTDETLFEVASCSKSYTALGILTLRDSGLVSLDDTVSKFFPWFRVQYEGKNYDITIRQLLHHTSGLQEKDLSKIPPSTDENALEQAVKKLSGAELAFKPGDKFEYATVNYDILGAIIQKQSGKSFEEYMEEKVFKPLGMNNTTLYNQNTNPKMAQGYQIGYFGTHKYKAPEYRGNKPAGYVISNSNDVSKWLMYQLGTLKTDLASDIKETQIPDRSVAPFTFDQSSYCMGWASYQNGTGEYSKAGLNPTFSAYMIFRPQDKIGVAVLSNTGTPYTFIIGHGVMDILRGAEPKSPYSPNEGVIAWDKPFTLILVFTILYIVLALGYLVVLLKNIITGKRRFTRLGIKGVLKLLSIIPLSTPFAFAIYLIPSGIGYDWKTALVWAPKSFPNALAAIAIAFVLSYVDLILLNLFRGKNSEKESIPAFALLTVLSGIGNYIVIFIINISVGSDIPLSYLVYFYVLAFAIYIFGRKVIETTLIKIANNIIYKNRVEMVRRLLDTTYYNLEKMDNGTILATLNNDSESISQSVNIVVGIITNFVTILFCFTYLGSISFHGLLATLGVIVFVALLFSFVSSRANPLVEEVRDTQNTFLKLLDGLIYGFKELSLHKKKSAEFYEDVDVCSREYRDKRNSVRTKFLNAFLLGESLLILILGVIAFFFPRIFPDFKNSTITNFIVIFLYLIGPINYVLNNIPQIVQMRVSYNRIKNFTRNIPSRAGEEVEAFEPDKEVHKISLKDLTYEYRDDEGVTFYVGPINLDINQGETVFITGGNGSGKTTATRLLMGLYKPMDGMVLINGSPVPFENLGEYFSAVFSDYHIFNKIYEVDFAERENEINYFIKLLKMDEKVEVKDGRFSTVKLSGGQRKRLALLVCLLEDRPVYMLDEFAADQDPEFKEYFYNTLLGKFKDMGKTVIAITHDDRYFHIADKVIKMDMGQVVDAENKLISGTIA